MFNRQGDYFIVTVNNLRVLEAISVWIYKMLKFSYFIQIELFLNVTVYYVCIEMHEDLDKKVTRKIKNYIKSSRINLLEES